MVGGPVFPGTTARDAVKTIIRQRTFERNKIRQERDFFKFMDLLELFLVLESFAKNIFYFFYHIFRIDRTLNDELVLFPFLYDSKVRNFHEDYRHSNLYDEHF